MQATKEAFKTPDVLRLTGVSVRQAQYWDGIKLIQPSIEPAVGSGSQRLYSFEDLIDFALMKQLLEAGFNHETGREILEKARVRSDGERPRAIPLRYKQIEITVWLREIERRLRKKLAVTELVTSEEPLPQNSGGKLLPLSKLR